MSARLMGGLGNQLFIACAGYTKALKEGREFRIDTSKWFAKQGEHPDNYKNTIFRNFEFGEGESIPKGYYQSLKYMHGLEWEFVKKLWLPELPEFYGTAIHIRRGDYLRIPKHKVCTDRYYEKAMEMFPDVYTIFTDDLEYCRQKYPNIPVMFGGVVDELAAMAKHHTVICSNSSFSWWASFVGKCKTVVPDRWFNDRVDEDIYRPQMIRIKTDG